jgi:hypothetical protein
MNKHVNTSQFPRITLTLVAAKKGPVTTSSVQMRTATYRTVRCLNPRMIATLYKPSDSHCRSRAAHV